jgi:oligopeptide/dipeptide ABC transporter ATP-binding protein
VSLLAVEHLTAVFDLPDGPVPAVDDVSFEIQAGETLGLVGESGSGKSITALSILRLLHPPGRVAGGRLFFKGQDLLRLDEPGMRAVRGAEIGLIFQEPAAALNPVLSVGAHIAEALLVHGRASGRQAWSRAIELLEAVRIPNPSARARDYPHQLSGGMRQRVLIAVALACRPSLLIADEPTTALDVTIQAEILDLLREMHAAYGLATLLITHDLGVVAQAADRVAVMYAGRIVESGTVRAILEEPRHPYTRALLAAVPRGEPGSRLRAIEGSVPMLGAVPNGCAFNPRCPDRIDRCTTESPAECTAGPDHTVRCHLYSTVSTNPAHARGEGRSDDAR